MKAINKYFRGTITDITESPNKINPYWGGFKEFYSTDQDKLEQHLIKELSKVYENSYIQSKDDYSYEYDLKKTICRTYTAVFKTNLLFKQTIQIAIYPIDEEKILD